MTQNEKDLKRLIKMLRSLGVKHYSAEGISIDLNEIPPSSKYMKSKYDSAENAAP